jgi:hypothetical protein
MWRRTAFSLAMVGLLSLSANTRIARAASDNPLVGVWRVAEGPAGAGMYMFTGTHYSMIAATTDRPDISDTSKATADELRAVWGPMLANAGAYEIAGDLLTIRPVVAKIPVVMKAGAYEVYRFRVEGDTLSLTQVRNVRGPVAQGATTKLVRVE